MSKIEVNAVEPQCGTTLTLGASGDTVQLGSGATAAGFGSTGEVSWNTTKITADPGPAVSGVGYFTDTLGSAFNITLPSSPSAGAVVAVADYANNWNSNAVTLLRNGSNIEGAAENFICNTQGAAITFVYVDATKGWIAVNSGNSSLANSTRYVVATGGTETTSGDWKIHTFTGPGNFEVTCAGNACGSSTVDYLVVAGGAGGGNGKAGGGGAGGFRESVPNPASWTASPLANPGGSLPVSVQTYPITVGGGGAGTPAPTTPGSAPQSTGGNNSSFSTIASAGGGEAGSVDPSNKNGSPGGSGGGASQYAGAGTGGTGNSPPVNPAQGKDGGNGFEPGAGGGGGGATSVGGNATCSSPQAIAGDGGNGAGTGINPSTCVGTPGPSGPLRYFSGGGGAAMASCSPAPSPTGLGTGGYGGGGCGQNTTLPRPSCATGGANTGGGGGGSSGPSSGPHTIAGGAGGSGIVIIRYKYQ